MKDGTHVMQTKQTQRLAERLRRIREKTDRKGNKTKWRVVCLKVKPPILLESGEPDTGLAYQIAYNGKEPEDRHIRERLGLKDICAKCLRPYRKPAGKANKRSPAREWFINLSREKQENLLEMIFDYLNRVS